MSEKLHTFQPEMPPVIFNIKMGLFGEESSLLSPARPQLLCVEDSSAADAQALNADPQPLLCYAQQHASAAPLAEEDSVSMDSDPQELQHSEAGDYGIVLPAAFEAPEAEVSPYKTQEHTAHSPVDACEDQPDHQDEAQIFLDWSPETRELKIPLMGLLGLEDEAQIQTEAVSLLPNVILRQSSEETGDPEDDFIKMERDWGLIIHSGPD